jgi:hypothetical protein
VKDNLKQGVGAPRSSSSLPPQALNDVGSIQIHRVLYGFISSASRQKVIHGNLLVFILLVGKDTERS